MPVQESSPTWTFPLKRKNKKKKRHTIKTKNKNNKTIKGGISLKYASTRVISYLNFPVKKKINKNKKRKPRFRSFTGNCKPEKNTHTSLF